MGLRSFGSVLRSVSMTVFTPAGSSSRLFAFLLLAASFLFSSFLSPFSSSSESFALAFFSTSSGSPASAATSMPYERLAGLLGLVKEDGLLSVTGGAEVEIADAGDLVLK